MVARDTYRWALIKHATTNPAFVAVAFPMPYSKYVLRNDKGPERNLKSYRSKSPLSTTKQKPSPLKKEVIYTAAELEPPAPIVVKPTKTARTVRWVVDDEPYEAPSPPPPPQQQQRRKGGRREHQTQTPCRSQYTPVRGVSMWFTAV
ncbi:uncharacterized protein LAJ45_04849 [Morchella importuna]|uniref:uncharacterized protein n=1 Tax=Morchella importuna TaxID=1174673 RepID=UPI001E8E4045|nr:uncharacterized protein LAJ45_04849 [Morchella importuna]KAH8151147.1 hypothetical protein LAJ45_04849 [Morchella importuna]